MFDCSTYYTRLHRTTKTASLILVSLLLVACGAGGNSGSGKPPSVLATGTAGAEQAVGERLFFETRFAQAFNTFLDTGGNVNDPNAEDPVVDTQETVGTPIDPGPFKGLSMNCRACHLVDAVLTAPGGGMWTYADFARRSPIPARADGKTLTPRNSPALVNSTVDRPGGVLLQERTPPSSTTSAFHLSSAPLWDPVQIRKSLTQS